MAVPTRLLIADDHALFREGLKSLLRYKSDFEIVAEVSRADEIAAALEATPCDVLLLDLQMDRWVLKDVEALARRTSVVVLTASERPADALSALKLGATAVVQKRFAFETLIEAIEAAAQKLVWIPPSLQTEITAQWRATRRPPPTGREAENVPLLPIRKTEGEGA